MNVNLPASAINAMKRQGITELMPIQAQTLDKLRSGVDVIARAKTGSGKTLAFLLPILEKLSDPTYQRSKKPVALVLEPTRELALQVARVLNSLELPVRACVVYGGESMTRQARQLRNGCDLIVGTPGRLCDFLDRSWVDLSGVNSYVVDEADRLLDMGFEKQLEQISNSLASDRQTIMFSATLPDWTRKLARRQLKSNQEVVDLVQEDDMSVPEQVRHIAALVRRDGRHEAVKNAIQHAGGGKALVFAATKVEVDQVARSLPSSRALHGGMPQRARETVLHQYRQGRFNTLVATDVASRGLDISDVEIVVHLRPADFAKHPVFPEDYIHRAGRVGRAGKEGTSVFLHSEREMKMVRILERKIGISFEKEDFSGGEADAGSSKRRYLDVEEEGEGGSRSRRQDSSPRDRGYLKKYYQKPSGKNEWHSKRDNSKHRSKSSYRGRGGGEEGRGGGRRGEKSHRGGEGKYARSGRESKNFRFRDEENSYKQKRYHD